MQYVSKKAVDLNQNNSQLTAMKQKMILSFCYLENFDRDDLEVITMEWGHLDFLEPSWRTTGKVMWDKVFRCNSLGRWIDGLKSTDLAGLRQHMVELD